MEIVGDLVTNLVAVDTDIRNCKLLNYEINKKSIGDGNYNSSEISRLCVNYEKYGKVLRKSYVMKIPSNSPLYLVFKQSGMYEKEYYMYAVVLPEMCKFVDESEYFSPKYYVSSESEILIIQDLSQDEYQMIDRRDQMDFKHAAAVLRTLAKFHCLSMKIHEIYPDKIDPLKKDSFLENSPITLQLYDEFLLVAAGISSIQHVHPKLVQFKNVLWKTRQDAVRARDETVNVLNHGDCWSSNILFRYEKDEIKVKFVDFQLSKWCSPAVDIMYMVICSIKFEVFESKSEDLLRAYYDSFSYWLRYLKCSETYSFEELKKDFQNCYPYGLSVMSSALPLVMKKNTDLNLNKVFQDGELVVAEVKKMYEEAKYIGAVTKWLQFYVQNGLI